MIFSISLYSLLLSFQLFAFTNDEKAIIESLQYQNINFTYSIENKVKRHKAAKLGREVFFDKRYSLNNDVSCSSCHQPQKGWSDNNVVPDPERFGQKRHVPSLFNLGAARWFAWDGRNESLWAQAIAPLLDPQEHQLTASMTIAKIRSIKSHLDQFKAIFPAEASLILHEQKLTPKQQRLIMFRLGTILASFVETIKSGPSRFDRFAQDINNNTKLLSKKEKQGLKVFLGKGRCISCHFGPNFTDNEFHDVGLAPMSHMSADPGRFMGIKVLKGNVWRNERMKNEFPELAKLFGSSFAPFLALSTTQMAQFKTPTLRNLRVTAPYMHNGSFGTLEQVVAHYRNLPNVPGSEKRKNVNNPIQLSDSEVASVVSFLQTLNGLNQFPKS